MAQLSIPRMFRWTALLLVMIGALALTNCTKEERRCGMGQPSAALRLRIVDDRFGLEWFSAPRLFSLDTLKKLNPIYTLTLVEKSVVWGPLSLGSDGGVPEAGGDETLTHYLRLSSTDVDTVQAHVVYARVLPDVCPKGFRYAKSVDFLYNGKPAGTYDGGSFYCSGCGPVVTFRKRQ